MKGPYRWVGVLHKEELLLVTHSVQPNDSSTEAEELAYLHKAQASRPVTCSSATQRIDIYKTGLRHFEAVVLD